MMKHFFKRKSIATTVVFAAANVAFFTALVSAAPVTRVVPIAATTVSAEGAAAKPHSKSLSAAQDTFHIPLKDSVVWLEMEKNTVHTICVDGSDKGLWKVKDFSYEKVGDCIQLNSGNYVKNGKIQYVTQIGHVVTFNLLVGMKYIDLSTQKHLLGHNGDFKRKKSVSTHFLSFGPQSVVYLDSLRYENINEILLVDEYKVTECEFIQTLWDSIPEKEKKGFDKQNFWINKKKMVKKGDLCDVHDSAAIKISPYYALVYANERSRRDGLKTVYTFEKAENWKSMKISEDGSFGIRNESFLLNENDESAYVTVRVDESADGYRLPYYNEWMAFARGGKTNVNYFWGSKRDSTFASLYAWFGFVDPDDPLKDFIPTKPYEKDWLKYSCGRRRQKSRPVGLLKSNDYGLYDILGLVCENVMMPGESLFDDEVLSCKGGFLSSSLDSLSFGSHCDYKKTNDFVYQGLRLVRQIK